MKRQSLVWIFGFAIAFCFHAFGAIGWLMLDQEDRGASDFGVGGLKVSIFMQATASGADASAEGETGDTDETKEKQVEEQPPQQQTEEKLVQEQPEPEITEKPEVQQEIAELEPETKPVEEEMVVAQKEVQKQIEEPVAVKVPLPKRRPKLEPLPKPVKKVSPPVIEKAVVTPTEKVTQQLAQTPTPVSEKKFELEDKQAIARAQLSQGQSTQSQTGESTHTKNNEQGGGNIVGTAMPDYVTKLRMLLERNKIYPKRAKRHRKQGTVVIRFTVKRDGTVLDYSISKKSGASILDKATIDMLKRSAPLPRFPDDLPGEAHTFTFPVRYNLLN